MIALLWVDLSAQTEMNYSYEMKYGDGKQVTIQNTADYFFFENLLDLNTYLGDNIYVFTQFEYSDPPVFGHPVDGLNTFYLEYQTDEFNLKLGDLYELYGRGLSFYTLQDQNIDYDDTVNQFMEADFRRNKRTISLSFEYKFGEFKKKKYIREDSHGHDHGGEGGMDVGF